LSNSTRLIKGNREHDSLDAFADFALSDAAYLGAPLCIVDIAQLIGGPFIENG